MLYHKDIGMPELAKQFHGKKFDLSFSHHAKMAAINDRYGVINKPPFSLTVTADNLIELELNSAMRPVKLVVRLDYDKEFDIVLAIIPDFNRALVKTMWLNRKTDNHFTLNHAAYQKP